MKKPVLTVSGSSVSLTHSQLSFRDLNHLADRIQDLPTTITSLVLNSNEIQDEDCCRSNLIDTVLTHKSIVTFEAVGNHLGIQTACKLANCLPFCRITQLKLGENRIGDEGCFHLGEALRGNVTLTRLHLGCNYISDLGLTCLASGLVGNSVLSCLGLRDNCFGASGMQALAQCLAHPQCAIEDLQLKHNNLRNGGAAALATALRLNRSLRVLELEATQLNGADIRLICTALKGNSTIHALNVNNNDLKDEGAIAIGNLLTQRPSALTSVGLRGTRISPIGAAAIAVALSSNTLLAGLDLGNNAIGTKGARAIAKALAQNQALQSIDLQHNQIHATGLKAIARALMTNTSLKNLDVSSNFSRDDGAEGWGRMLQTNRALTRLSITDNEITNRGGQALLAGLRRNVTLRFLCFGGLSQVPPGLNTITPQLQKRIKDQLKQTNALIEQRATQPIAIGGVANELEREEGSDTNPSFVQRSASPHPPFLQEPHHFSSPHQPPLASSPTTQRPQPVPSGSCPSAALPAHPTSRTDLPQAPLVAFCQIWTTTISHNTNLSSAHPLPTQPQFFPLAVPLLDNSEDSPETTVWLSEQNETASDASREEGLGDSRLLRYTRRRGVQCVTPLDRTLVSPGSTPGPSPTQHTPSKQSLIASPKTTLPEDRFPNDINLAATLDPTQQLLGHALFLMEAEKRFLGSRKEEAITELPLHGVNLQNRDLFGFCDPAALTASIDLGDFLLELGEEA